MWKVFIFCKNSILVILHPEHVQFIFIEIHHYEWGVISVPAGRSMNCFGATVILCSESKASAKFAQLERRSTKLLHRVASMSSSWVFLMRMDVLAHLFCMNGHATSYSVKKGMKACLENGNGLL